MDKLNGRQRVIISNVSPQLEGGKYPAKATLNERVFFSANIFADGHDDVGASVFVKHEKDRIWKELPLKLTVNDLWKQVFMPQRTGSYFFKVQAWPDHFTTWQKGLQKKFDAGQDIRVELQIGEELLADAASRAIPKEAALLRNWIGSLQSADNQEDAVRLAMTKDLSDLMRRYRDKDLITSHDKVFRIEVEEKKALFSSWYELFPRSASLEPGKHGTFKDVKRLLPRIADMGFDVLYFPPSHPIGEVNRKGKSNSLVADADSPGSPWAIGNVRGGHKAIHPQLGSLKD